jgi:hypothetical protein
METIQGRKTRELDLHEFKKQLTDYDHVALDLGTGDGRYARTLAGQFSGWFIVGLDACRENLRVHSQANLKNLLFVIASAQSLPKELSGLISHVAINFPWGSLLDSLLVGESAVMDGLESVVQRNAMLDLRLNSGALAEAGSTLEAGAYTIYNNLCRTGWAVKAPVFMSHHELRAFPSTWAKRLAFGRDPRAMLLTGRK